MKFFSYSSLGQLWRYSSWLLLLTTVPVISSANASPHDDPRITERLEWLLYADDDRKWAQMTKQGLLLITARKAKRDSEHRVPKTAEAVEDGRFALAIELLTDLLANKLGGPGLVAKNDGERRSCLRTSIATASALRRTFRKQGTGFRKRQSKVMRKASRG